MVWEERTGGGKELKKLQKTVVKERKKNIKRRDLKVGGGKGL